MAEQPSPSSTSREFNQWVSEDPELQQTLGLHQPTDIPDVDNALSLAATPSLLNTAFVNDSNIPQGNQGEVEIEQRQQHSQSALSQQQSQTTRDASSSIHSLLNTIVEQEHQIVGLRPPTKTMVSTGTMPRTPTTKSIGTMPRTSGTPLATAVVAVTTTVASLASSNETIDLCSSTPSPIDPASPDVETIDLRSPETPTNVASPEQSPRLAPQ